MIRKQFTIDFLPTLEQKHRREIDESPSFKFYAELMLNPERDGISRRSKEAWPRCSPNWTISVRRRRLFFLFNHCRGKKAVKYFWKYSFHLSSSMFPRIIALFREVGAWFLYFAVSRDKNPIKEGSGARDVIKLGWRLHLDQQIKNGRRLPRVCAHFLLFLVFPASGATIAAASEQGRSPKAVPADGWRP